MILILGPTACGKTALAVHLALRVQGEIISMDSRQVYRGMTIGTGKDYNDYTINGVAVPYHLIDIRDPGYEYNVFEFLTDLRAAQADIRARGMKPVLCGGSGMYIDAVVNGYRMTKIKEDPEFSQELETKTDQELAEMLSLTGKMHNTTDLLDRGRMIRALLINREVVPENPADSSPFCNLALIGIRFEREVLRKRITERLEKRIQDGMIREVEQLLRSGLTPAQLKFYGLEYKFITLYLEGVLTYPEMFCQLNTAIHQFSKRQMTWFRKMEREGHQINWLDGTLDMEEKVRLSLSMINL